MKDFYKILNVEINATSEEIKQAYRKLAKKWHPDKWLHGSKEEKLKAEMMMKDINEAYDALKNSSSKTKIESKPKSPYAKEDSIWDIDIKNLEKFF